MTNDAATAGRNDTSPVSWNVIAQGWHKWVPQMREWYELATNLMLNLAGISPGARVLDVAAGDGDQSLAAALRVGLDGYVLAIDAAAELLALAERSARQANVANLETRVMEAEDLRLADASFDAVICRFGLMLFSDPARALAEMNRVLRSGGRASLVVYGVGGTPDFSLALTTARGWYGLPEERSAATSVGEPDVLDQILRQAGFREVVVHTVNCRIVMASAAECVRYLQDTSPTLRGLMPPSEEQHKVWEEIEGALWKFEGPTGFQVDHQVLVASGMVPGHPST
ncbi:MAG: methyltransferase domain-containing protein [Actinomycetota bacterium]|nr:methyltransferase domain-containing protein [Actinomycetota bacterium]